MTGIEAATLAIAKAAAGPAIKATADKLKKTLDGINTDKQDNADAAMLYMETACQAMNALEEAVDRVLLDASRVDREEPGVQAVQGFIALAGIDDILTQEELRPVLSQVLGKLEVVRNVLTTDAKRVFGRLPAPKDKLFVIAGVDDVIKDIRIFLATVDTGALFGGPAWSAPHLGVLVSVKDQLEAKDWATASYNAGQFMKNRIPSVARRTYWYGQRIERVRTTLR